MKKNYPKPILNNYTSYLLFLVIFFFTNLSFGQTIIWSTGFEGAPQPVPTLSNTTSASFNIQNTGGRTAAKCSQITGLGGGSKTYDGSVITNTTLNFATGKFYVVEVYAKVVGNSGRLQIMKNTTNTNAAMKGATGGDVILSSATNNVSSTSYVRYTGGFTVASNESKYIGIQMFGNNNGGDQMILDDITITEYNTPQCESYCKPNSNGSSAAGYISNVTYPASGGINRTSGWDDYVCTGLSATVRQLVPNTLSVTKTTTLSASITAWIDLNRDGDYADAGEQVATFAPNTTATQTQSITIPTTSVTGITKMRVMFKYNAAATPCDGTNTYYDVEDYEINILPALVCSAPTAQPTTLNLAPNGTSIAGSFTAASPAPDNYIVFVSTSATPPNPTYPVNGTTYTIGNTYGVYKVVDTDSNTSFIATGLTINTLYYFYIYSYNSFCTGGAPLYLSSSPLTGNVSTIGADYCTTGTSSSSTVYIDSFETVGNITNMSNTNTGYTNSGYNNYTSLPATTQIPGGGITAKYDLAYSVSFKAWVDWDKNGTFSDTTERVYDTSTYLGKSTSFGFVVPVGTSPGTYRLRVRAYDQGLTLLQPCGSLSNGETEDYTIKVVSDCAAKITSVTDNSRCGTGTVTLSATATVGVTEWRWYTAEVGGTLAGTSTSSTWTTPSLSTTTVYWVAAWNGSCESYFRQRVIATIKPVSTLTFTTASPTICGENSIITLDATGTNEEVDLVNEPFEGATLPALALTVSSLTSTGHEWTTKTSTFIPTGTAIWKPAINSREAGNKFAYTTCNMPSETVTTRLVSGTLNTTAFTSLTLTFRHYFSYYASPGDHGYVEYSTDNGATWPVANQLFHYQSDQGEAGQFTTVTISLPAVCLNQTQLKVRFNYASTGGNGWAIDDVRIFGSRPLSPNFTWTGSPVAAYTDAACTIPYISGTTLASSTVYIKPTLAQLELGSYSFTANANLANSCTTSATINATNNSKVWKGTTSSDWNIASNWLPSGVPTTNTCVIIPTGTTSQIMNAPDAVAKNVTVKAPTGNLELQSAKNLTVTDFINVEAGATFNVRNSANLVQVNNAALNSGSINMDRTAVGLHAKDYILWSSPVENFGITSVSPLTNTSRIYHWTPDVINGVLPQPGYGWGNWQNVNENMIAGKGYAVRVPNSNPTFSTTFTGKPQNGVITRNIVRGPYTGSNYTGTNSLITNLDDNWNLVGNPYPSAIDAVQFLSTNSGVIEGDVSLWTHTTPISISASPYYQTFVYNYKSNDYVIYNSSGNNVGPTGGFNGKIAAGQAFFVKMKDGAAGSGSITFNNSMRSSAHDNGQFYKTSGNNTESADKEKSRVWLDLIDSNFNTSRIMFGYMNGATNEKDHMYDATTNYAESLKAFTTIKNNDEIFVIQGKSLPFNKEDKINFGYQVPENATYKIAISDVDGLFKTEGQKIYIEDLLTNTTHDLTTSPYSFTSEKGTFKNRFIIKYNNQTLSDNDSEFDKSVIVFGKQQLTVKSELLKIKNIVVYDLLGKTLININDINTKEYNLMSLKNTNNALLVKVTLDNGAVVTKKAIF